MKTVILWAILAIAAVPCWAGPETRDSGQQGTATPRSQGARSVPVPAPTPSRQGAPDAQTLKRMKRPAALPPTQRIPVQPAAPTPRSGAPGSSSPTALPSSALGKNVGILEHPDLMVIGPEVTETVLPTDDPDVSYTQYAHSWTVRNQGNAVSHSTQVQFVCKDNYPDVGKAYCANGAHNWTNRRVEIPPLDPGATYVVHSSDYGMPIVAGIKKAPPEGDPEAPAEFVPHWLRFTATADPDHLVDEINRQNNTAELVVANMSEKQPSFARATKRKLAAGTQGAGSGGSSPVVAVAEQGAGAMQVAPRYAITTEDPWSPGTTTWVLATNNGKFDASEAHVKVTCVNHTHVEYNAMADEYNAKLPDNAPPGAWWLKPKKKLSESCSFVADQEIPVPALAQGEMHPLLHLTTAAQDAEAPSGFGWGLPGNNAPPSFDEIQYTITFRGPGGDQLVLSTKSTPKLKGFLKAK